MALVKPSGTISDIKGKIGGTVFFNSGAGLAIRSATTPVNRNTLKQNNQRIIIADLQNQWQQLTTCQRTCWQLWIKRFPYKQNNFYEHPINAQQAFIKINVPFRLYGKPIITNPVFSCTVLSSIDFDMSLAGGQLFLDTNRVLTPATEFIELFCTVVVPETRNNPGSIFKSLIFTTIGANQHDVSTAYTDIFGILPSAGQKIFFKARLICAIRGTPTGFQQKSVIL